MDRNLQIRLLEQAFRQHHLDPDKVIIFILAKKRGSITSGEVSELIPASTSQDTEKFAEATTWLNTVLDQSDVEVKDGPARHTESGSIATAEEEEFIEQYKKLSPILISYAATQLRDPSLAPDFVHETFLRFWKTLSFGSKVENVKSFLFRTLRNLFIDMYRKKNAVYYVEDVLAYDVPIPSEVDRHSLYLDVLGYVNLLQDEDRHLLCQRFLEDRNPEDLAQELNITINNLMVRTHRAVHKVRQKLAEKRAFA